MKQRINSMKRGGKHYLTSIFKTLLGTNVKVFISGLATSRGFPRALTGFPMDPWDLHDVTRFIN